MSKIPSLLILKVWQILKALVCCYHQEMLFYFNSLGKTEITKAKFSQANVEMRIIFTCCLHCWHCQIWESVGCPRQQEGIKKPTPGPGFHPQHGSLRSLFCRLQTRSQITPIDLGPPTCGDNTTSKKKKKVNKRGRWLNINSDLSLCPE
jgi:hypothetical protein